MASEELSPNFPHYSGQKTPSNASFTQNYSGKSMDEFLKKFFCGALVPGVAERRESNADNSGNSRQSYQSAPKSPEKMNLQDLNDLRKCYRFFGCAPQVNSSKLHDIYKKMLRAYHPDQLNINASCEIKNFATAMPQKQCSIPQNSSLPHHLKEIPRLNPK